MAGNKKWMQKAAAKMKAKGTEGTFTAKAKAAGMSVQEFAKHVLANKKDYSKKTIMQAVFASRSGKIAKGK